MPTKTAIHHNFMHITDKPGPIATEDDTPAWRQFVFGDENLPDPDYPLDHVPGAERL
ncbi:hypothetical protein GCM10008995_16300 [Halobellus salinus]|uniref:Uncharacterized protein n=1 Tax=Halobellus salinus TaxID=931585 RepID=A0A830EB32_9EURY|nr:hypothetical protein [Halobellus salinus]GGJ07184.1 hypothetical protein GCM10008995_16300 [Halobellus salinus]